jgi:hypothetical protein
MSERTPTQQLSDVFYGLQIIVKILEGLVTEHKNGLRCQNDYEMRFHSQATLLCKALADVRPLAEKIISDGYSKYESRPVSLVSGEQLLTGGSGDVVEGERLQDS